MSREGGTKRMGLWLHDKHKLRCDVKGRGLPSEHPEPATPSDMYQFPLSGISGKCLQIHPNPYEYTSIRLHRMPKALKM